MGDRSQRLRGIRLHTDEQGLGELVWRHTGNIEPDKGRVVKLDDEFVEDVPFAHIVVLDLAAEDLLRVAAAGDQVCVDEVALEAERDELFLVLLGLDFFLLDLVALGVVLLRLLLVALGSLPRAVDGAVLGRDQQTSRPLLDFIVLTVQLNDVSELVAARQNVFVDEARAPLLVLIVLRKGQIDDEAFGLGLG